MEPINIVKALAVTTALTFLLIALMMLGGCAQSTPAADTETGEASSGWTDADNRDAARMFIIGLPHSTITVNDSGIRLESRAGNERAGSGSAATGSTIDTTQTPTSELTIPALP